MLLQDKYRSRSYSGWHLVRSPKPHYCVVNVVQNIYKKSLCGCLYYGHVGVCVRACRSRRERCYLCLSVVEEDRLNNLKAYSELKKQSAQFCQSAFLFS